MTLAGLAVDLMPARQDGHILSGMPLVRRDIVDASMLVLMVVPVDEAMDPVAGSDDVVKALPGEVRDVFAGPEQGLDKGVVVTDPGSAERGGDAELTEHHLDRLTLDHAAVVTMQYQRLTRAALLPNGLLDQVAGVDGALVLVYLPAHDLAAIQVHDHVQEEEPSPHRRRQPGDIPTPDSVGCGRTVRDRRLGNRGLASPPTMVLLILVPQDAIEGRLRGQVHPFVGQGRDNLPGRPGSVLRRVADGQNRCPFFWRQGVGRERSDRLRASVRAHLALLGPALVRSGR